MKAIKILLKVIVAIIALVVVALLALPLWFGPVVKTVDALVDELMEAFSRDFTMQDTFIGGKQIAR